MTKQFARRVCAAVAAALTFALSLPGLDRLASITPAGIVAEAAQGNQGLQGGWAVDDSGQVNFYHGVSTQYGYMQSAGAGWVRVNFRLGACYSDWQSVGCNGRTALQAYDEVVANALAHNLKVLGLLSNETWPSWPGGQLDWLAKNAEKAGGNGHNAFTDAFAERAGLLAAHFAGKVTQWEVWNEPNAWVNDPSTHYNPAAGDLPGGTFLYPSNFAWLLKLSYEKIKAAQPSAVVISGGLFAHEAMGVSSTVVVDGARRQVTKRGNYTSPAPAGGKPDGAGSQPQAGVGAAGVAAAGGTNKSSASSPAAVQCTSTVPAGADSGASYLCSTYRMGAQYARWKSGAYPLDQVGQHLYLDQGGATSSSKITTYLSDLRNAYVTFEGSATPKKTHITEVGWQQPSVSLDLQAQNLSTAYSTFRNTGYVGRAYWFSAQDVWEANLYFGLMDSDGAYKPAFSAYQSAAAY